MTRLRSILVPALILIIGLGLAMFFGQRSVLFPRPIAFTKPTQGEAEPVALPTGSALLLSPAGADRAPVVLFFHGNGETADLWIAPFEAMRSEGWSVLLVEYPGYGDTPGRPSQASIFATARAAYDWALSSPRIDSSRIVLYGRSLGSGPAAHLAAERSPAALIIESGFTSVRPLAARLLVPGWLVRDPFDNLAALKRYRGPLLVIHGDRDEIIPLRHGQRLAAAVPGSTLITQPCGHNDCPGPGPLVRSWLGKTGLTFP